MTGYKILVVPQQNEMNKLTIGSNDQQNIRLGEDNLSEFSKKVDILIDYNNLKLEGIDMDTIKHKINEQDIFTQLKLDSITNSKLLVISSKVIFINNTNESIHLLFSDKSNKKEFLLTNQ